MTDWYGLTPQGKQIQITGADMANWAFDNELQISVGWSDHFTMPEREGSRLSGARLVRGFEPEIAERVGWKDIATMMRAAAPKQTESGV